MATIQLKWLNYLTHSLPNCLFPLPPLSPLSVSVSHYGSFFAFAAAETPKQWPSNLVEKVKVNLCVILCATLCLENFKEQMQCSQPHCIHPEDVFVLCWLQSRLPSVINFSNQPLTYLWNSVIAYSLLTALG